MIPQSEIDAVMSRVHIDEVIGLKYKRVGSTLKCCCPFHTEKTPSFTIYPNTNTYKCYGCGKQGTAVTYLMEHEGLTFVEAIHNLADKYHITLTDKEDAPLTIEQKRQRERYEQTIIAYNKVNQFFINCLKDDTPEAKIAYEYAVNRWGAEFVNKMGVGYAYNSFDKLRTYAQKEHIPEEILVEVGLLGRKEETGHIYDFFRGRIMIPIRSTSHLIIAYTARVVEAVYELTNEPVPSSKYINSPNSFFYQKNESVFGMDQALSKAASQDKFYMVEGGPDVLRLQSLGISNTVASLGSDWTPSQLHALRRHAHKVSLIPDIDVPKDGKVFGVGIEKVMKTGEKCLAAGFENVSVKDISMLVRKDKEGHKLAPKKVTEKQDADSYFLNTKLFEEVQEMDYIVWYAAKLVKMAPDDTVNNVATLSRLLSYLSADYQVEILLTKIGEYIDVTKATWRDAIKNAKRVISEQRLKESIRHNTLDADLLERYGFQEKDNHYIAVGEGGKSYPWSNFVLHPLFHVKDANFSSRIFTIINEDGYEEIIELSQEDLASRIRFSIKIESLGNFLWLTKDEQLIRLKRYLYQATDTAYLIRQMGWQRRGGFYAFGNGVFDGQKWIPADEYGIASMGDGKSKRNYYLPSASRIYADDPNSYQFERLFIHSSYKTFTLREFVQKLVDCFGENAMVGFAFLVATLFRDIIIYYTKMFPILNVFGVKGTGKSELGHSLMSFFIINNIPTNIQNATVAALAEAVAQCSNALVHIDEYKNVIDISKMEFLKGLWDGAGRSRMNIDRDKKREITQVEAGVILTGQEMPNGDNALFSRLIFLKTKGGSEQRSKAERDQFQELVQLRKQGCSHLTLEILGYRAQFEANIKNSLAIAYEDLRKGVESEVIEERLINNWCVPLAAIHALRNSLDIPFGYNDLLKASIPLLIEQNNQTRDGSEVSAFWNIVDFLYRNGRIREGVDFKIECLASLRVQTGKDESSVVEFKEPRRVLFFRHRRIMELYQAHLKSTGEQSISKKNMLYYLKSDVQCFIGEGVTKRFNVYLDGNLQYTNVIKKVKGETISKAVLKETTDQPLCFDYDALRSSYGLQLQNLYISETNEEKKDESPPPVESQTQTSLSFADYDKSFDPTDSDEDDDEGEELF